jgi:hydrogenase maturation protease
LTLAVIGLGNVLLGDDGFGPFVIELLRARCDLPPEVELLDLGTPGLFLTTYLHQYDDVIIVDAVAGAGDGVRVWEGEELAALPIASRVSPHDPALPEALSIARAAAARPREACLIGAEPRSLELGAPLTEPMRAAAEAAACIVLQRLKEKGFDVGRSERVHIELDWWQRANPAP